MHVDSAVMLHNGSLGLSQGPAWAPVAWAAPGRRALGRPLASGLGSRGWSGTGPLLVPPRTSPMESKSQVLLWQLLGSKSPSSRLTGHGLCSMAARGGAL